jgi:hypothetical protein
MAAQQVRPIRTLLTSGLSMKISQFSCLQKPLHLAARGDQANFSNHRFIAVKTLRVEAGPDLLRTTSSNRRKFEPV